MTDQKQPGSPSGSAKTSPRFIPRKSKLWLTADLFFLTRPTQFFPIWATLTAGYLVSGIQPFQFPLFSLSFSGEFWLTLLSVSLGSGSVFVYNQAADMETDRINGKLLILSDGLVSREAALWLGHGLTAAALLIAGFLSKWLVIIYLLAALAGIAYNFPPASMKNRPFSGIFINAAGGFLCFLAGAISAADLNSAMILAAVPYGLAWGGVFALVTIPDMKGDLAAGKRTLAVAYGSLVTRRFAFLASAFALLISFSTGDWVFISSGLISLPFYLALTRKNEPPGIFLPVKLSFISLIGAAGLLAPVFFILNSLNFAVCRWYYRFRYRIRYPDLSPVK